MERDVCNKCEGIVCADTGESKRYMTQKGTGKYIEFPEQVENCPRLERAVFDNILGWQVPVGRPDLMMPVYEEKKSVSGRS